MLVAILRSLTLPARLHGSRGKTALHDALLDQLSDVKYERHFPEHALGAARRGIWVRPGWHLVVRLYELGNAARHTDLRLDLGHCRLPSEMGLIGLDREEQPLCRLLKNRS
jgi:hypothetical protein